MFSTDPSRMAMTGASAPVRSYLDERERVIVDGPGRRKGFTAEEIQQNSQAQHHCTNAALLPQHEECLQVEVPPSEEQQNDIPEPVFQRPPGSIWSRGNYREAAAVTVWLLNNSMFFAKTRWGNG